MLMGVRTVRGYELDDKDTLTHRIGSGISRERLQNFFWELANIAALQCSDDGDSSIALDETSTCPDVAGKMMWQTASGSSRRRDRLPP
jgi:hypothetical protein